MSVALETCREAVQPAIPARRRPDGVAHVFVALAVAIEVAVLKYDPGLFRRLGDETDLDLARLGGVGLELPLEVEVPRDHQPVGRFVSEHIGPASLAPVRAAVVDMATLSRLEDHLGERCLRDVMLGRPLGEMLEYGTSRRVSEGAKGKCVSRH